MDEKMGVEQDISRSEGVSRRKLLKLLAAAGLAVSVERLLPGGWLRPAASVSAGGFPGYPGICTADDFPLVIIRSRLELANSIEGKYQMQFTYNEIGGFIDNDVCIFADVVSDGNIYNGNTIVNAEGYVNQVTNASMTLPCLNPISAEGRSAPVGAPIYQGNGVYYFYYSPNSSEALPTGRDAADELTIEWFLLQPDDRMSNTVQTIVTPLAVSLSDFEAAEAGDKLKTAAAAGAAAALGAVTVKALANRGEEQAPQ